MKMENNIRTDRDGIVKAIRVQTDDVVIEGKLLMEIE
jgi:biotin carboxyl carrier protein